MDSNIRVIIHSFSPDADGDKAHGKKTFPAHLTQRLPIYSRVFQSPRAISAENYKAV